jgi:hypothetical protein
MVCRGTLGGELNPISFDFWTTLTSSSALERECTSRQKQTRHLEILSADQREPILDVRLRPPHAASLDVAADG